MYTDNTYDDYLRNEDLLSDLASAFGYADDDDETMERCPMCGDRYPTEDFDSYKGQRMCPNCMEIERVNDATESLSPDFRDLFDEIEQAV